MSHSPAKWSEVQIPAAVFATSFDNHAATAVVLKPLVSPNKALLNPYFSEGALYVKGWGRLTSHEHSWQPYPPNDGCQEQILHLIWLWIRTMQTYRIRVELAVGAHRYPPMVLLHIYIYIPQRIVHIDFATHRKASVISFIPCSAQNVFVVTPINQVLVTFRHTFGT